MKPTIPIICLISLLVISCKKENAEPILSENTQKNSQITIGKKLENPYSLKNMQKALDSLLVLKGISSENTIILEATDLYVRFRPTDTTQYRALFEQGLELFDYPLDCEITQEGSYYHDPTIPEDEITWQYAVVPTTRLSKDIQADIIYEVKDVKETDDPKDGEEELVIKNVTAKTEISGSILERCYIPMEDFKSESNQIPISAEELENMAISIARPNDLTPDTKASGTGSPRGYVKVYDDVSETYVPIPGVKVRARYFLKWRNTYTDNNGYFYISTSFKKNSYLSVIFENSKGFSVWGNLAFLAPAYYNDGKQSSFASLKTIEIKKSYQSWPWAVISKSAYDYYTSCSSSSGLLYGVQLPHPDLKIWSIGDLTGDSSTPMARHLTKAKTLSALGTMLSFCTSCLSLKITSSVVAFALHVALPDMFIGSKNANYQKLYLTIQHEFTHASHFRQIGEWKWGDVIWYEMLQNGYPASPDNSRGEEYVRLTESYAYSIDNYINKKLFNKSLQEKDYHGNNFFFFNEIKLLTNPLVNGTFTPKKISQSLNNSYSFDELKKKLGI